MRHSEHYSPYSTNVINIEDAQSGPPSTALRHSQSSSPTSQKRKIERACDFCRRRKTRCDGPKTPGNICTNCIQNQKSCTYVESSKPRGPPKAYVTALEDRVENLEAYLQKLRPDVDFSDVLGPPVVRDSWRNEHPGRKSRSPQVSISANRPIRRSTSTPTFTSGYLASSFAVTVAGPDWASSSIAGSPRPFISRPMLSSAPDRQTTDDVYSDNESMFSDDSTTSDSECYGELDYGKEVKRIMVQDQGVAQDSFTMDLSENELSESEAIPCCWRRFHGKSSSIRLVGSARRMKLRHMTEMSNTSSSQQLRRKSPEKRKEFWVMPSWEIAFEGVHIGPEHFASMVSANMPPPELAESLISLYFQHANVQFPLLHWPTFHKLWVSGCHHNDVWFTCMCFAMFAVASRWSDDERVLCDVNSVTCGLPHAPTAEEIPKLKWRTAGWKYHNVVVDIIAVKRSILQPATLFEIQSCTLIAMFLWGTSHYPNSWLAIEIGVRKAQDKGIHRRKAYNNVPQVKAELWKRAWWLLVAFDRITSASLGRTCCTRDEDFDIDLPLEVDDEYWEPPDANLAFRQPPGKPSLVTAFNSWVRLTQITAFTVRTFYAVDKSQGLLRLLGPDWRSRMVKKMNAALAQWYETVPAHLRWSSTMENKTFANQAVTLFTTYHLARIMIYRPFIRAPDAPPESQHYPGSPGMENSELAICTEAARECARIIATQLQRGFSNVYNLISVSHICAALLLMNVWDIKAKQTMEAHSPYEPTVDMMTIPEIQSLLSDVAVFLRALEYASDRWSMAATHLTQLKNSLPSTFDYSLYTERYMAEPGPSTHHPRMPDRSLSTTGSQVTPSRKRRLDYKGTSEDTVSPTRPETSYPVPPRSATLFSEQRAFYHGQPSSHADARLRTVPKSEPLNEDEDLQVLRGASSMPDLVMYRRHVPMQPPTAQAFTFTERPLPFISNAGRPRSNATQHPPIQAWHSSEYPDLRNHRYQQISLEGHLPHGHPGFSTSAVRNTHPEQVEDRLREFTRGDYRWDDFGGNAPPPQSHSGGMYRSAPRGRGPWYS